ncbi:hypothetical protein AGRA3207_006231 [Actinomadura graeca]|uniref:Uncharacterized protein n=1 Tax=Actinomadura graeca TaxID=2750812 RepID=A0ABX8R1T3_9ACTN|nr:hypothetical protein [Actinomadura graeca]QXJ24828.1 hypothetical protein AGRA3207_006231 [Actinomadura graeca]
MGLRERLAADRPFVVTAADGTRDRLAVEADLRARGRRQALSPVETGHLVVCGEPGAALGEAIETVWRDMPEPRVRVGRPPRSAPPPRDDVAMADRADDRDGLRLDVLHLPLGPVLAHWPAGLRLDLAVQGDVIQSAGVTLVDTASGSFWDEPWRNGDGGGAERRRAASHLDSIARFLHVAGWPVAAARAAELRDAALGGVADETLLSRFVPFARRVGRSRALRWMTRGLGVLTSDEVERHGAGGPALRHPGDVKDRLDGWLVETGSALERAVSGGVGGRPPTRGRSVSGGVGGRLLGRGRSGRVAGDEGPRGRVGAASGQALAGLLPALVEGTDLAAARLIVASLDPDLADG